jgi:N-acetyl-gamma-glutamyl-phosphate reductase
LTVTKVGIIGASGYTGLELIKLILAHPYFELSYVSTSEGGTILSELHPALLDVHECDIVKADAVTAAQETDLVFLALPHKTAMEYVKELMKTEVKVVDLSADYRLEKERYEEYYCPHIDASNLKNSVYGLPELHREAIKNAQLVANPGCYPTSAILGILPFVEHIKSGSDIIVDAKSGVSGAGKKCSSSTHYVSINDNLFAYNPLGHRHGPEIFEKVSLKTDKAFNVQFVPHLIPATRGMLASVYLQLDTEVDAASLLKEYYKDEKMVRVRSNPVDMKSVAGTNFCDIFVKQAGTLLFISSAIDNLLRGASSQAIANANLMCGYEEVLGLPTLSYVP